MLGDAGVWVGEPAGLMMDAHHVRALYPVGSDARPLLREVRRVRGMARHLPGWHHRCVPGKWPWERLASEVKDGVRNGKSQELNAWPAEIRVELLKPWSFPSCRSGPGLSGGGFSKEHKRFLS